MSDEYVEAAISTSVLMLREPVTHDVAELAGAVACAESRVMFGPSGGCRFYAMEAWDDFVAMLKRNAAPDDVIENCREKWMEPSPAEPFRIGVIHLWCPVGQSVPDDDDTDWTRRLFDDR